MSFVNTKKTIENGDLVLAWISRSDLRPIDIKEGEVFQTRFGAFPHASLIGKKFGSQVPSVNGRGFIHLLAPTPELWAMSLPHRTQIVYSPDASYIVQRLGIRPNSRVIEAGTGSGALTHALARTVSEQGRIFTFEYHENRCQQAKAEFEAHGLGSIVTITHRNVCEDKFTIQEPVLANSVFLDLPAPWLAVPHLLESEILDRRSVSTICCFSPCIEQVIKTLFALRDAGFQQMETVECQARRWEGHVDMVRTVDEAVDVLRDVRVRRTEGIERKRARKDGEDQPDVPPEDRRQPYNPWGRGRHVREGEEGFEWQPVSWMESEVKSHTSYLTFAVLPPVYSRDSRKPKQEVKQDVKAEEVKEEVKNGGQ